MSKIVSFIPQNNYFRANSMNIQFFGFASFHHFKKKKIILWYETDIFSRHTGSWGGVGALFGLFGRVLRPSWGRLDAS